MSKYKVYYSGYVYVEADDEEEAMEIAQDGYDVIYEEKEWDGIEEVDDFAVDF